MQFTLDATPDDLETKGDELIKSLMQAVYLHNPELAERLEKALPEKKVELRDKPLQQVHKRTAQAYKEMLEEMTGAINKVITQAAKAPSFESMEKAQGGPYIGPRGGKWADPEHTEHWEEGAGETKQPEVPKSNTNEKQLIEDDYPLMNPEFIGAAKQASMVGADNSSLRMVGFGGEADILTDKSGKAYRVLHRGTSGQKADKVKIEYEAVNALKGTPAEKFIVKHYPVNPQNGVIVRDMVEGRPGGWGTAGLVDAFEVIREELNKRGFSSPEFKEDSFVVDDKGKNPVMVDMGFMYYRGKREIQDIQNRLDSGDPKRIDMLDQPFAIRSLIGEGHLSWEDAVKMTIQLQKLKGKEDPDLMKTRIESLESRGREMGKLKEGEHLDLDSKEPPEAHTQDTGAQYGAPVLELNGNSPSVKQKIKRTPVKASLPTTLRGQKDLFEPHKIARVKSEPGNLFREGLPTDPEKPKPVKAPLPGQLGLDLDKSLKRKLIIRRPIKSNSSGFAKSDKIK